MNHLDTVQEARAAQDTAARAYRASLQTARDHGHTLRQIAQAAGVTVQAVAQATTRTTHPRPSAPVALTPKPKVARVKVKAGKPSTALQAWLRWKPCPHPVTLPNHDIKSAYIKERGYLPEEPSGLALAQWEYGLPRRASERAAILAASHT